MRYAIAFLSLLMALSCARSKVDPGLVGTWELNVPNADGVARWVWVIHAGGTYDFHAEGPGGVPSHSGIFEARNGKYTLRSTTMAWDDNGTYQLIQGNTLSASGRLGTASWTRVQPAPVQTPNDSQASHSAGRSPDSTPRTADGGAGIYSAATIYDYLSHHTFDDRILTAPLTVSRTETVDPDGQERSDGVIGIVQAEVRGSTSPATISFVVYRDRAAAEAARDIYAMYDSKTFRMKPGEFVSSHAYTYRERGEARCLSRLLVGSSSQATVTCYLLVQYPTRDPVMIESELTEQVGAKAQEASIAAVDRADDLLFAGIKEWALTYPSIGGGDSR
ncbi:MAG TPA: hypothetical protein VNF92_00865 [Gemmatimonadaceae bacterium]|nr:hypothetical protein [Gemmatimonadaceae bacterium]